MKGRGDLYKLQEILSNFFFWKDASIIFNYQFEKNIYSYIQLVNIDGIFIKQTVNQNRDFKIFCTYTQWLKSERHHTISNQ